MIDLPGLPTGSAIRIRRRRDRIEIWWRKPARGCVVGCGGVALAVATGAAGTLVYSGVSFRTGWQSAAVMFLLAACAAFLGYLVYRTFIAPFPERIVLRGDLMTHEHAALAASDPSLAFRGRPRTSIRREQLTDVRIDREQGLVVLDVGGREVLTGSSLGSRDLEWLHNVLRRWLASPADQAE